MSLPRPLTNPTQETTIPMVRTKSGNRLLPKSNTRLLRLESSPANTRHSIPVILYVQIIFSWMKNRSWTRHPETWHNPAQNTFCTQPSTTNCHPDLKSLRASVNTIAMELSRRTKKIPNAAVGLATQARCHVVEMQNHPLKRPLVPASQVF